jgi:hypothetical protein
MIEIALIVLKFAALITGGVFAAIGLLTDYRDKHGTVTKWGKIALFGIVLCTIIGAGTQAVESYRERQHTLANEVANREVLREVRRAVFPLRSVFLQQFTIVYPAGRWPISEFLKFTAGRPSPSVSDNGRGDTSFDWVRESSDYPEAASLREIFEPHLQVLFWKKGANPTREAADLTFGLSLHETRVSFFDRWVWVRARTIPISDDSIKLSQRMGSFEDVREGGEIQVYVNWSLGSGRRAYDDRFQEMAILDFRLSIASHEIEVVWQRHSGSHFVGRVSELPSLY